MQAASDWTTSAISSLLGVIAIPNRPPTVVEPVAVSRAECDRARRLSMNPIPPDPPPPRA
jgi:hypothetical protein